MAKRYDIILRDFLKRNTAKVINDLNRDFFRDTSIRVILGVTGIILIAIWLVAFFRFQPSDFMVPTRYNSFLGVTMLGRWADLYYIPAIATLFALVNIVLGSIVYRKDKMVGYIIVAGSIFVAVLALVVVINFSILVNI